MEAGGQGEKSEKLELLSETVPLLFLLLGPPLALWTKGTDGNVCGF
jgi:hypothetical protein